MLDTAEAEFDANAEAGRRASLTHWQVHLGLLVLGAGGAWLYYWGRDLHRFIQWLAAYESLYIAQLGIYAVACWLVWRRPDRLTRRTTLFVTIAIIAFAMTSRFELVAQKPYLSADVYRYIWDGRVQAAGVNPYRYPPNAPELESLRDQKIFNSIPAADLVWISPYPPVAQAVFYAIYSIHPSSPGAFKTAMSLFDLVTMVALALTLARIGQDPARVVLFAWHPMLIYESAHSGHLESVYIAFIALALLASSYGKSALSGAGIGLATMVKFYPALLLPAFLGGGAGKRLKLINRTAVSVAAGFAIVTLVFWLPYSSAGTRMFGFASSYIADEGFAGGGSRYYLLDLVRRLLPVPTWLFVLCALLVFAIVAMKALRAAGRGARAAATAASALIGAYLLITSPRYAWYHAWLLPFLCLAPRLSWFYLASAAPLLYLVWYTPEVYPNLPLWLGSVVYLPVVGLLLMERWRLIQHD
jgi:hypothetical protein